MMEWALAEVQYLTFPGQPLLITQDADSPTLT